MTNEETKQAVDILSTPATPEEIEKHQQHLKETVVAPKPTEPIQVTAPTTPEPKKEVKPMAEDPTGMFDYSDCKTHVVQDGETLFDIAEANHVALQQLRYFNHINKATLAIRPNQTIYIPNKPVPVPAGEQMLTRYDTAPINSLSVDSQTGFLRAKNVPIARVGVFPYLKADGSLTMEAKLPDELLADSTVESANNKPVTDEHPNEAVNTNNTKKYMKGFTADNAHVDGDKLKVDMTITDSDLISEIQKGKQELSIGFETDIAPVKGTYKGMAYDSVQRNIQINHVAVVRRGRAGHSVRLTGDSAEMVIDEEGEKQEMDYKVVHLSDGSDITVASNDVSKVTKLDADNSEKAKQVADIKAQIKALQAKLDKLQGTADANQKSADQAQAKADSAEKELSDYKKKFNADALDEAVAKRMDLIAEVKPFVGDSFDFKGKSERDMKIEAIKSVTDSIDFENKSDDYVDAYFDSLEDNHKPSSVVGFQDSVAKTDSAEDETFDRYHLADMIEKQGGND